MNPESPAYKALLDSLPQLIWSMDRNGTVLRGNAAFERVYTARQSGNANGFPVKELFSGEPGTGWGMLYKRCLNGAAQHVEICSPDENGSPEWWEISLYPVTDSEGRITEIAGSALNSTLRKNADNALLLSERKFRSIFEALPDIYFQTDNKGIITLISPSVTELFHLPPARLQGCPIQNWVQAPPDAEELLMQLLEEGSLQNLPVQVTWAKGETLHFICNIGLLRDHAGNPVGFDGLARNISELKTAGNQIEEERRNSARYLRIREQFLANMSHEIRTPVNGIMGAVELLAVTPLSAKQQNLLKAARESSAVLSGILNDILDVSKMEAADEGLSPTQFSLHELGTVLQAMYTAKAQAKGIGFSVSEAAGLPQTLFADKSRLLKALSYLISNAIKFTFTGRVSLNFELQETNGSTITIAALVSDTGIGISEKTRETLYTPFTQGDGSETKSHNGVGLGLALCRQTARIMNGDLSVESEPGKGSVFTFLFSCRAGGTTGGGFTDPYIQGIQTAGTNAADPGSEFTNWQALPNVPPLPSERPAAYSEPAEQQAEEDEYLQNGTLPGLASQKLPEAIEVLVVEDNPINLLITTEMLRNIGCRVTEAESGFAALDALQPAGKPDNEGLSAEGQPAFRIVFMDVQMPRMDGCETARKIKQLRLPYSPVIIALTAYAMPGDRERFLAAGMDDYLSKPITGEKLLQTIQKHLTGKPEGFAGSQNPTEPVSNEANPPSARPTETPALNRAALDGLLKYVSADTVAHSLREYEAETAELLCEAWSAVADGNPDALLSVVHTIKGTSLTLGAAALGAYAAELENTIRQTGQADQRARLSELQELYRSFCLLSRSYLENGNIN